MENQKEPFPQFINPHRRRHFHWAMFLIVSLALAAALLIVIENFKTAEEIDSMAPNFYYQVKSDDKFEDAVIYQGRKVEFGKLVVILKDDQKNSDVVIAIICDKAQGTVVQKLKTTQTYYIIKFKVNNMEELENLKKQISEMKEVKYASFFSKSYFLAPEKF